MARKTKFISLGGFIETMNTIYSVITGLAMHAYEIAAFLCLLSIPATLLFRAFEGKHPL